MNVWINEKKVSGIGQGELNLNSAFPAFAAARMGDLAFRATQQPVNLAQAQNLVSDFEVLVDSPNRLGIFRMPLRR